MHPMAVRRVAIAVPGWAAVEPRASVLLVSADPAFSEVASRVLRQASVRGRDRAAWRARLSRVHASTVRTDFDRHPVHRRERAVPGRVLRHCPGARVIPVRTRPRNADDLLELVEALLPVPQAKL